MHEGAPERPPGELPVPMGRRAAAELRARGARRTGDGGAGQRGEEGEGCVHAPDRERHQGVGGGGRRIASADRPRTG
eukprot:5925294-Pleurochrysis_carterae.AAC.1